MIIFFPSLTGIIPPLPPLNDRNDDEPGDSCGKRIFRVSRASLLTESLYAHFHLADDYFPLLNCNARLPVTLITIIRAGVQLMAFERHKQPHQRRWRLRRNNGVTQKRTCLGGKKRHIGPLSVSSGREDYVHAVTLTDGTLSRNNDVIAHGVSDHSIVQIAADLFLSLRLACR